MKTSGIIIGCLFLFGINLKGQERVIKDQPSRLENTFSSCSVYQPAEDGMTCTIQFREKGATTWKQAFPPVYDGNLKEFRGSIVLLEEDTEYEVCTTLLRFGQPVIEYIAGFRTWTSNPPIGQEVLLSKLFKGKQKALEIKKLKGTPDAWIRIVPDCEINAGDEKEYALRFAECEYLILEGAIIRGGYRHGVVLTENVSNVRLINCDISKWGRIGVTQNDWGQYLDKDGLAINNDAGIWLDRSKNVVIERCYIHDPSGWTNPWNGVVHMGEHAGKTFSQRHPKGPNGVLMVQNGGNFVMRYNDIVGSQRNRYNDPVEGWRNGFVHGAYHNDADIYGNMMGFGQDDGIELDGGQCNVRLYGNRFEQLFCGMSLAPNMKGPSYVFRNVVSNLGCSDGSSSAAVKNGGGMSHTAGRQFMFNNTMIFSGNGMRGVGYGPHTPENKRELFRAYTRNNIFLATQAPKGEGKSGKGHSISDIHRLEENDFDYDMVGNLEAPGGRGYMLAREGSEVHGVFAIPHFTDACKGIYTLRVTDPGIDRGMALPNFMEDYTGERPSMGAFQYGASSLHPVRPIDIESDAYYVQMKVGETAKVTLKIGELTESRYTIRKAEDMDWLQVETSSDVLKPNSTLTLTLKANRAEDLQVGALFVRLANGFSVPITIYAEK